MRRQLVDHITLSGKVTTDHARAVLQLVHPDSALDRAVRAVIDRYLAAIDIVDLEEDVKSLAMLEEVSRCEGIEDAVRDCVAEDKHGRKKLTIRGFVPPAIEIHRETTSFRPASFRPDGYPGTQKWFDRMDGADS